MQSHGKYIQQTIKHFSTPMCKEKLLMFLNAVGLKCCLDTIRGLTKTCEYKNNISYGKKKKD